MTFIFEFIKYSNSFLLWLNFQWDLDHFIKIGLSPFFLGVMQHTFTASWKFKMVFDRISIGAQAQHLPINHLLSAFSFITDWKSIWMAAWLTRCSTQWYSDTLFVLVRIQNKTLGSVLCFAARWINYLFIWLAQMLNIKIIKTNRYVIRHCIIHKVIRITMRMFSQQSSHIFNRVIVVLCTKCLIVFCTLSNICYKCSAQWWI